MNFKAEIVDSAIADLKRLSKKHQSLKNDFGELLTSLEETPVQGEPLGKDCYKVRLAILSKRKGKSGGGRIITCVKIVAEKVYILAIYDKSEADTINSKEIERLLKNYGLL